MPVRRFTAEEHALVVELYRAGESVAEIARRLKSSPQTIKYLLDIGGEWTRLAAARRERRGRSVFVRGARHDGVLVSERVPRVPLQILSPPEARMAACRAFAAGEITRQELSLRIRNV